MRNAIPAHIVTLCTFIIILFSRCKKDDVDENTDIIYSGKLVESYTGKPVSFQDIALQRDSSDLVFNYTITVAILTTNIDGQFSYKLKDSQKKNPPSKLYVPNNGWRCDETFSLSLDTNAIYELPSKAFIELTVHRQNVSLYDSIQFQISCGFLTLSEVKLFTLPYSVADTTEVKPIAGNDTRQIFWLKWKNGIISDSGGEEVTISGNDTAVVSINY
jgi:hypothetical protein